MKHPAIEGFDSMPLQSKVDLLLTQGILLVKKQIEHLSLLLYWYDHQFVEIWVEDREATAINRFSSIHGLDPYLTEINLGENCIWS